MRQIIFSIEQLRFKRTWILWTFQACLGQGQSLKTWKLHRGFYDLCRRKQSSGLAHPLEYEAVLWLHSLPPSSFLYWHLIFSQDSTNYPGLSAQGLPLGKHFWPNLTLAASLLFSHPLALGCVAAPACKAAITDVFVKLRRHKADVLAPCLGTHEETISIIAAPSWTHCNFFLIFLVYKFLTQLLSTKSLFFSDRYHLYWLHKRIYLIIW